MPNRPVREVIANQTILTAPAAISPIASRDRIPNPFIRDPPPCTPFS